MREGGHKADTALKGLKVSTKLGNDHCWALRSNIKYVGCSHTPQRDVSYTSSLRSYCNGSGDKLDVFSTHT